MPEKAYITHELLKWARQTAKISIPEVAHKMKVKESQIIAWENGEEYPTISQAQNLSKFYRRALAVFFLPEPPQDFETLRDFRKKDQQKEYSTALTFMLREIQTKQIWMSDFLQDEGEEKLSFIGRFSIKDSLDDVAANIRQLLEIGECPKDKDILKYWTEKAEEKRIFICFASNIHSHMPIDVVEVRGFAISDEYAPFIFINSGDSKNAQLFTLVHELTHLWINSTGISNLNSVDFRNKNTQGFDDEELFCNEVTAKILMPEDKIVKELEQIDSQINIETVETLAKIFRVSSYAVIVRLLNLGKLQMNLFIEIKDVLEKKYLEYLEKENKKEKKEIPIYYPLQIRRNSRSFTNYIYNMYKGGIISGSEASGLLNMKINSITKLGNILYT